MDNPTWKNLSEKLYKFIHRKIKDKEIAKDILQDVLLKILEKKDTMKNSDNYEGWIFQITRNLLIDYYRKNNRNIDLSLLLHSNESNSNLSDIYERFTASLNEFIKDLPPKYKEPLILSDIQGLNQKVISEKLNLTLSATKSRIQRARKLLKDNFWECSSFEFDSYGKVIDFHPKGKSCICNMF